MTDIKPARYAALAHLTEDVLSRAIECRDKRRAAGEGSLLPAPASEWAETNDPWLKLSNDFSATLHAERSRVSRRARCVANKYALLVHSIDPERHVNVDVQLMAGINTASSTLTNLMRNIPRIITRYNTDASAEDFSAIARNSPGLAGRLALGCVNRLMAAREGLAEDRHKGWVGEITDLDPSHFTLKCSPSGHLSLHYTELDGIAVPPHKSAQLRGIPDSSRPATVGEVACSQKAVIGCPITLLHGRLRELWNWQIDEVEARGLWEAET